MSRLRHEPTRQAAQGHGLQLLERHERVGLHAREPERVEHLGERGVERRHERLQLVGEADGGILIA